MNKGDARDRLEFCHYTDVVRIHMNDRDHLTRGGRPALDHARECSADAWTKSPRLVLLTERPAAALTAILALAVKPIRCRIGSAVLLWLAAAGGVPAMAQTRSEIVAAMEHGDYITAYCGFRYHAEQGDADAQTYLGNMYYNGDGVSQDYVQSAKWYLRAAEQGDAFAQHVLAAMYDEGLGVSQDYVQAYKWFDVAASRFRASQESSTVPQLSQSMESLVTLYRDQVALKLSTAQLAHAKRLAREWRPRIDAGSSPTRTWRAAVAAYEREDYGTAYCGFREHAAQGDTRAQYNLVSCSQSH